MKEFRERVRPTLSLRPDDEFAAWNRSWLGRFAALPGIALWWFLVDYPLFEPYAVADVVLNGLLMLALMLMFVVATICLAAFIDIQTA